VCVKERKFASGGGGSGRTLEQICGKKDLIRFVAVVIKVKSVGRKQLRARKGRRQNFNHRVGRIEKVDIKGGDAKDHPSHQKVYQPDRERAPN